MNESAAILYYVVCKYKENFDEEYCYDVLLLLWISLKGILYYCYCHFCGCHLEELNYLYPLGNLGTAGP